VTKVAFVVMDELVDDDIVMDMAHQVQDYRAFVPLNGVVKVLLDFVDV
jgi:hypothetical protein